jgi:hypothetical protein
MKIIAPEPAMHRHLLNCKEPIVIEKECMDKAPPSTFLLFTRDNTEDNTSGTSKASSYLR